MLFVAAALATAEQPLLADAPPDRPDLRLPEGPMAPGDVDALRFPMAARGYRMDAVDEALARLRDELADRDRRLGLLDATVAGESVEEPPAPVDPLPDLEPALEPVLPLTAVQQDPAPPVQAVAPGAVAPVVEQAPPTDDVPALQPPEQDRLGADLPPADLGAVLADEDRRDPLPPA